ncbi:MAG TPA: protein translocase subunit SecF [Chloroflexota bacterium]|nr:protein translocase subunit SecF [Chloroflexota bacterium]
MHIMRRRALYYIISLAIILPGIISLAIPPHLKLAVDFTGGTLWELQFQQAVQPAEVKAVMAGKGYPDAVVQTSGDRGVLIRSKEISSEGNTKSDILQALQARFGPATELRFESVGPVIGQEIATRAIAAVFLASIGILLYIAWAFRKVDHPVRYGLCAIIALLHDALVVLGIFSILGHLFNVEVDSLFVTAVLTVIGFSVHDTIVVFDRIRENARRLHGLSFEDVVNHSLLQTLGRSLATSLTVLFTLSALTLFGGVTIRLFALTLLIGIISGTYSSIFNASALLVSWENGDLARLFGRRRVATA